MMWLVGQQSLNEKNCLVMEIWNLCINNVQIWICKFFILQTIKSITLTNIKLRDVEIAENYWTWDFSVELSIMCKSQFNQKQENIIIYIKREDVMILTQLVCMMDLLILKYIQGE